MKTPLDSWNSWLQQPGCRTILEEAAKWIYRQATKIALPADLLPCSDPWSLAPSERQDCFQMLADDLWLYLKERGPELLRKKAWRHWAESNERALRLKITQDYMNQLKDRARILDRDAGRSLYRRLRQILKDDPEIHYQADPKGSYFSLVKDAPVLSDGWKLRSEGYELWESPLGSFSEKDLRHSRNLLQVASRYWYLAREHLGRSHYMPVRELVYYLQAHYAHFKNIQLESAADPESPIGMAMERKSATPADAAAHAYTRTRLTSLAEQLAIALSDKQAAAFYWIQGQEWTLQQTAGHLGYQSAAGARYPYERACEVLRDFCRLWPGLSPPDLDEKLWKEFVQEVLKFCKVRS